jgi:mannose-6-phosphate isomerase-like protein (cupin superfamily)
MANPGDVIENPLIGDRIVFRHTRQTTDGALLEFDLYAQPGAAGPPCHVHPQAEEHFEILKGNLRAEVAGQEMSFSEGDSFTVAAGVPHTWWNDGKLEAHVRVRLEPEAGMESFLETIYGLAVDGKTNARGIPNPLQLAVTASAYFDTNHVATPPLPVHRLVFAILRPVGRLLGYTADYPYPYRKPEDTLHEPARRETNTT